MAKLFQLQPNFWIRIEDVISIHLRKEQGIMCLGIMFRGINREYIYSDITIPETTIEKLVAAIEGGDEPKEEAKPKDEEPKKEEPIPLEYLKYPRKKNHPNIPLYKIAITRVSNAMKVNDIPPTIQDYLIHRHGIIPRLLNIGTRSLEAIDELIEEYNEEFQQLRP